ncbi:hypothetical protein DL764_002253 [Monosporascus ibericus]|uniref:RNA polymerase I-specific transcription initiation factor RRN6-like protein n=1 Tax=Monosporascus ibericus TaxID=155417 RepID=A0A4Q4TPN2_9PEZI|nr:hypothetical protein DL764_002253 [Monosporascus ibericus]
MLPKKSPIKISGSAWENSRRQKTWLLKSHPEARLGSGTVHDLLSESHAPTESDDDAPWHPALFAIGELADKSGARGVSSTTFLALAVGGANNILRLAMLDKEEWRWKEENVGLRLVNTSHYQPALWDGGVGSIRRLKCVVNSKRYDPTRWLIVQWESESRVFQPEFRRTPSGPRLPGGEEASRIAVNPLFSLSRSQTGGHSHTDAAFNPNTRSKPPQLGLIDEKGYWSIWDVTGFKVKASGKLRTNLRKCGHIENGVLKQLPHQGAGRSDWHTLLWVGGSDDPLQGLEELDLGEDTALPQSQGAFPPLERTSTLLLGSSKLLRLLDLNTNVFLPDISFVSRTGLDRILDVQLCPQDSRYFFVLTTSRIFVVGIFTTPGLQWDRPLKQWSILLSSPHHRDGSGPRLKLGVVPGAKSKGQTTTLITIYSTGNSWLDIFHINFAKHDRHFVSFYREATALRTQHDGLQDTSLQAMQLHPVVITAQPSQSLNETARLYAEQQIRFYQLVILDAKLRVTSGLCVSSGRPVNQITAPNHRVEIRPKRLRERRQLVRDLASRFIVPDNLSMLESGSGLDEPGGNKKDRVLTSPAPQRFLKSVYEQLDGVFESQTYGQLDPEGASGGTPFDNVQFAVQEAMAAGRMPAATLLQIIQQFDLPEDVGLVANDMSIASSPAPQSQKSPGAGSQRIVGEKPQEDETEEEPAMVLLRSYTGSGKFVPRKRFELLNQWQIGADPENHIFDLDKEKEVTPGMQRGAKILARESRKRRRAETLLQKIQREPNLPTTQPAPEVRFSQRVQPVAPFSTQSQLHSDPLQTMSQPVAGAFAQRAKKRSKRKTGF